MRLEIRQCTVAPSSAVVLLDGVDISRHLLSVSVEWRAGDLTIGELRIAPDEVEIDAAVLARVRVVHPDGEAAA